MDITERSLSGKLRYFADKLDENDKNRMSVIIALVMIGDQMREELCRYQSEENATNNGGDAI